MPEYPSAQALLEDARLRIDVFGAHAGAMVVEGWDDKRLFRRHTVRPQQILVAGGKRLLLAARKAADSDDAQRMVFIADCDYDVPLGRMKPDPNLIITTYADVEADLISLGVLEHVVGEFVPTALRSDNATELAEMVRSRATALACEMGRIRVAALQMAEALELDRLDLHKFRARGSTEVDAARLARAAHGTMAEGVPFTNFVERVCAQPSDYSMCNGHDLLRSVVDVLRRDLRSTHATDSAVALCARSSLHRPELDAWAVTARLRAWEDRTGRQVLIR